MAWFNLCGRGAGLAMALLTTGLVVAGCGASLPTLGGSLPGWFTSSDRDAAPPVPAGVTAVPLEGDCPPVEIRRGAATLSVAVGSEGGATASDLQYQLTFHQFARQCVVLGGTVRMRVGVQGRVVVGPAGAPEQVSVPLRYAVMREGVEPKPIATKFHRFTVEIPASATNVSFTDIEEDLSFPMPPIAQLQSYIVYIGFDDVPDRPPPRGAKKKARPTSASVPR
jgi:hypothetical protein